MNTFSIKHRRSKSLPAPPDFDPVAVVSGGESDGESESVILIPESSPATIYNEDDFMIETGNNSMIIDVRTACTPLLSIPISL